MKIQNTKKHSTLLLEREQARLLLVLKILAIILIMIRMVVRTLLTQRILNIFCLYGQKCEFTA